MYKGNNNEVRKKLKKRVRNELRRRNTQSGNSIGIGQLLSGAGLQIPPGVAVVAVARKRLIHVIPYLRSSSVAHYWRSPPLISEFALSHQIAASSVHHSMQWSHLWMSFSALHRRRP